MPSNSVTARISSTDRQNHANDGPFTKGLRKVLQKRLRAGRCPSKTRQLNTQCLAEPLPDTWKLRDWEVPGSGQCDDRQG